MSGPPPRRYVVHSPIDSARTLGWGEVLGRDEHGLIRVDDGRGSTFRASEDDLLEVEMEFQRVTGERAAS